MEEGEDVVKALLWMTAVVVAASVLVTGVPAIAHHASAPFYDPEKRVEAVGTVTKFVFRNPHSFLYVDAKNDAGEAISEGSKVH